MFVTWRRNPLHKTIIARGARSELFSSPLPELDSALAARSLRDAEEKLVRWLAAAGSGLLRGGCGGKQTWSILLSLKKEESNKEGEIKYFGAKERLISSFMHVQWRHGDIKDLNSGGSSECFHAIRCWTKELFKIIVAKNSPKTSPVTMSSAGMCYTTSSVLMSDTDGHYVTSCWDKRCISAWFLVNPKEPRIVKFITIKLASVT